MKYEIISDGVRLQFTRLKKLNKVGMVIFTGDMGSDPICLDPEQLHELIGTLLHVQAQMRKEANDGKR